MSYAGRLARNRLELRRGDLGTLQRRGIRQLDIDDEPSLVLLRDEARGGLLEDPVGQDEQAAVDQENQQAHVQQLADEPAVDVGDFIEDAIESAEEPAQELVDPPDQEPPDQPANEGAGSRPDGPAKVLVLRQALVCLETKSGDLEESRAQSDGEQAAENGEGPPGQGFAV